MRTIISTISAAVMLFALSLPMMSVVKAAEFFTIGTGGPTGVYFQVGNSVCKMLHKQAISAEHGRKKGTAKAYRCTAPSTGGSNYNIGQIKAGEFQLGVAQSDWQYNAYNGSSKFKDKGANLNLRAIFSVHPEPFTLVASADSGIRNFNDLKGKRVNVGNPGSGQRGTLESPPGRGDFPMWVMVGMWLAGMGLYVFIGHKYMVPNFPLIFLLGFAFLYTPLNSYITARTFGVLGRDLFELPYIHEMTFILSRYEEIDVWFVHLPDEDYGRGTQHWRVLELTGTTFTSNIAGTLLMMPILIVAGILVMHFVWQIAPIPSAQYPYANMMFSGLPRCIDKGRKSDVSNPPAN